MEKLKENERRPADLHGARRVRDHHLRRADQVILRHSSFLVMLKLQCKTNAHIYQRLAYSRALFRAFQ
jgi:hypothetical protein